MDSRLNQVETLFSEWDSSERPGAVLAIVENGRTIYTGGFGMASIEHGLAIDTETRFRIASVSKQFLVTVVMMLVQEGKIALDDDIRAYDTQLPDFGQVVTIRHALSMNSGMRDYLDILDWSGAGLERPVSDTDIRAFLLRQRKLNYTPGEMFIYTNTGYRLVNAIVERIIGKPMAEILRERIFAPLGMEQTRLAGDWRELVPRLATPHLKLPSGKFIKASLGPSIHCEGGIVSTLRDLLKWHDNFLNPVVGNEKIFAEMASPMPYNNGTPGRYGMGLMAWTYRGQRAIGHGGLLPGFRTDFTRYPELGFAVIISSNADALDPHQKARQIADIYLADKLLPVPAATPKEKMQPHCGLYADDATGELIDIHWDDGQLQAGVYGMKIPLKENKPGMFEYMHQVFDMQIKFDCGTDAFNVSVCGNPSRYQRVAFPAPVNHYQGVYFSDELNAEFIVSNGPGGLELSIQGQFGREVFALEARQSDVFEARQKTARHWYPFQPIIRFQRDGRNNITGIIGSSDRSKNLEVPKQSR